MLRVIPKLVTVAALVCLANAYAAGDDNADAVKLTKLTDIAAPANSMLTGGVMSPDGKLIAVNIMEMDKKGPKFMIPGGGASMLPLVKLVDATNGKQVAVIHGATATRFSADSKVLSVTQTFMEQLAKSGKGMGMLSVPQLWDLSTPAKPKQLFVVDGASQESFSADGRLFLAAVDPDQKYGNSGKAIVGAPKTGSVGGLGMMVMGGSTSQMFELWEVSSAKFVERYQAVPKGKATIDSPVFSPDGKLVAAVASKMDRPVSMKIQPGKDIPLPGQFAGGPVEQKIALFDVEKKSEAGLIDLGEGRIHRRPTFSGFTGQPPLQFASVYQTPGEAPSTVLIAVVGNKDAIELNLYDPIAAKLLTTLHREKKENTGFVDLEFCVSPDGKTLAAVIKRFAGRGFNAVPGQPAPKPNGGAGGVGGGFGGAGGGPGGFGGGQGVPQVQPGVPGGAGGIGGPGGAGVPGAGGIVPGAGPGAMAGQTGEVIIFDLEKRAKKHTLAITPQHAQFASDNVLGTIGFYDKSTSKLKLWDCGTGKDIGGLNNCGSVEFSSDGTTMLTRSTEPNTPLSVWTIAVKK